MDIFPEENVDAYRISKMILTNCSEQTDDTIAMKDIKGGIIIDVDDFVEGQA